MEFLGKVVPGVTDVVPKSIGKKETLEFRQLVGGNRSAWRFPAENMSDGTLRALGLLAALFQTGTAGPPRVPFVGIEEPETAVHPGAAGVLRDALRTASASTQVVLTSHSPDLLDDKSVSDDQILAVASLNGDTQIGPVDPVGRSIMRDRLYTAGELLRQGQLQPDPDRLDGTPAAQLELFGDR
ncbi:MAG: AAA family ATPase [Candidatus Latescibacterota bacterium]